jgi:hypothetical protein
MRATLEQPANAGPSLPGANVAFRITPLQAFIEEREALACDVLNRSATAQRMLRHFDLS